MRRTSGSRASSLFFIRVLSKDRGPNLLAPGV
jgi:hypothetical protein